MWQLLILCLFVKMNPEFFPLQSPCCFLTVPTIASLPKWAQVQQSFRIAFNLLVKLHTLQQQALHCIYLKTKCIQCFQSIIYKVGWRRAAVYMYVHTLPLSLNTGYLIALVLKWWATKKYKDGSSWNYSLKILCYMLVSYCL